MGPRLTVENLAKIKVQLQAGKLTKSQAEAILGPPTQNLGAQPIPGTKTKSTSTLRWVEGAAHYTIFFRGVYAVLGG